MTTDELSKLLDDKLQPIEKRLANVEKTMATKDDLKQFATKDDLKGLATKNDLKKEIQSSEKRLKDYLDEHFNHLDQTLSQTMQRVIRLEDRHPELPPFTPITVE